jgi:predicted esterase
MINSHQPARPVWIRLWIAAYVVATAGWGWVGPACADDSEGFKAFQANWEKAQQAYAEQRYAQAALYYDKVTEFLPFEPTTRFQLACCHARLGDKDKAMATLEAAVNFGWDDPQRLEQVEALKSLRDDPRFAKIAKGAAACADETTVLFAGKGVDTAKPAPLVVLLQGLGCGPRGDVPYWRPAVNQLGLVLVAPRAPTKVGSMLYGWHRPGAKDRSAKDYFDMAAAEKRIQEAVQAAERRWTIDQRRICLAGFSQGGGVALRMLGDRPDRYCGAVAICSLYQPPGVAYWRTVADQHPVRVFAMAGKLDRLLPQNQLAVEQLREAKIALRYEEMAHQGHEYPPEYPERLARAIAFVLGVESPKR